MAQLDMQCTKDPDWLPSVSRDITDTNDYGAGLATQPTSKHDGAPLNADSAFAAQKPIDDRTLRAPAERLSDSAAPASQNANPQRTMPVRCPALKFANLGAGEAGRSFLLLLVATSA